jgi:hypothetical protein
MRAPLSMSPKATALLSALKHQSAWNEDSQNVKNIFAKRRRPGHRRTTQGNTSRQR